MRKAKKILIQAVAFTLLVACFSVVAFAVNYSENSTSGYLSGSDGFYELKTRYYPIGQQAVAIAELSCNLSHTVKATSYCYVFYSDGTNDADWEVGSAAYYCRTNPNVYIQTSVTNVDYISGEHHLYYDNEYIVTRSVSLYNL